MIEGEEVYEEMAVGEEPIYPSDYRLTKGYEDVKNFFKSDKGLQNLIDEIKPEESEKEDENSR